MKKLIGFVFVLLFLLFLAPKSSEARRASSCQSNIGSVYFDTCGVHYAFTGFSGDAGGLVDCGFFGCASEVIIHWSCSSPSYPWLIGSVSTSDDGVTVEIYTPWWELIAWGGAGGTGSNEAYPNCTAYPLLIR